MNRRLSVLSFVAVLAVHFVAASAAPPRLSRSLEVSVVPKFCDGEPRLEFTLVNVSSAPITLVESQIPWRHRYSITLIAVPKNEDPLPVVSPIDDNFGMTSMTIEPGAKISGQVQITRYAQKISEKLRERDLVVFWYFEPTDESGNVLGEFGGWVRFARETGTTK